MTFLLTQFITTVYADERESLEQLRNTTLSLIDMLVKEGVLSKTAAENLVKEAQAAKQSGKTDQEIADQVDSAADKVVRVQYVPESVKQQMKDEIKQDVMDNLNYKAGERLGVPEWIDRITPEGDLRLRYQREGFSSNNFPASSFNQLSIRNSSISNTTTDTSLWRVRARLGAKIKITDWLEGGVRASTGSLGDPISGNQNLDTSTGKYTFALDRAFLKAHPYQWATLSGGRMENPWFHTDLMWDPDLAFDGIAASASPKINENLSTFGTVGAFPIEQLQSSQSPKSVNGSNKWLYGAQGGIIWNLPFNSSLKLGIALYDFTNVEGKPNTVSDPNLNDNSVPAFHVKGNNTFDINENTAPTCGVSSSSYSAGCALASKFKVLNLIGQFDYARFNPVHVILTTDYIQNLGFDAHEILLRTGNVYQKETQGYQVKLAVGMPETLHKGDWQLFGAYKRLEADSTMDAFTDDDFNLGGTDTKGWIMGASYGLDKNVWTTVRWMSSSQISGYPLSIDTVFFDLQAKF